MKLRPTHRCYDDALELIVAWLEEEPLLAVGTDVLLVHGICTDSDDGHLYAHAWVERDGFVWNGALNENGERVYLQIDRIFFLEAFGVREANCYSIRAAWEENRKSGHYGPWTEEHRKLTGPRGSIVSERATAGNR